ncbi:MAG: 3-oxoacyl-ACP reductase FabG [Spirochaetaceae bacterium]|nr:3-oxoacyl-ACP reductase FabG [Spirochaetaceae bacterium]
MSDSIKVALVTGGTRGIGKAICLNFAQNGFNIVFTYKKSKNEAQNLVEEIRSLGVECHSFQVKEDKYEIISDIMKDIIKKLGRLDILVNNAGKLTVGPFIGMRYSDYSEMLTVNLKNLYMYSKLSLPYLSKNKNGFIINISSFSGYKSIGPAQAVYSATKGGIIGFTRSLSRETMRMGIRVNAVAPGLIETDMICRLSENIKNDILKGTTAGTAGYPEDIANAVSFLISDKASYINGQTILVDGGSVSFQY